MIKMTKIRLINWHRAWDETAPVGDITLFIGRNASGKSTILDAILYALYSDTNFNSAKGGKSKGKRTLESYTRGFVNNDTRECLRPVKASPEVYSHIILEFYNDKTDTRFILGTVIKTCNDDSRPQPARYLIQNMTIDDMECTYMKDGKGPFPYTDKMIEEKYGIKLIREVSSGVEMFWQAMGCSCTFEQVKDIRRTQDKIISYDKQADIGSFIKENVLEAKENTGFSKLAENKKGIEMLTEQLKEIDKEYGQVKRIVDAYADIDSMNKTAFACDAALNCITLRETDNEITEMSGKQRGIRSEISDRENSLAEKEKEISEISERIDETDRNLRKNDYEAQISDVGRVIERNESATERTEKDCKALSELQDTVNEVISCASSSERSVLSELTKRTHTFAEKQEAVEKLRKRLEDIKQEKRDEQGRLHEERKRLDKVLEEQNEIIRACREYKNNYKKIRPYTEMCEEINREFKRRGIDSEAKLACDYVISLKDEEWRDAIENVLGEGRYIILTEPEYYNIAYEVFCKKKSEAHLMNTRLLTERHGNTQCVEDSPANMLEISNGTARLYFDYRLGYIHAVSREDVPKYENAVSKDGMRSQSMDCYQMDFSRRTEYFLGGKSFELNLINAQEKYDETEAEIDELSAKDAGFGSEISEIAKRCDILNKNYAYDCFAEAERLKEEKISLDRQENDLLRVMNNDLEYTTLHNQYNALKKDKKKLEDEKDKINKSIWDLKKNQESIAKSIEKSQRESEEAEERKDALRRKDSVLYNKMKEMVKNGELNSSSRKNLKDAKEKAKYGLCHKQDELNNLKLNYNMRYKPIENTEDGAAAYDNDNEKIREKYLARARNIDIKNRADIEEQLKQQEKYYKDTFKNEAILGILKECRNAKNNTVRALNAKLRKINFGTNIYQFVCRDMEDGTEYGKILSYAKYLADESAGREIDDGQLTLEDFMPENEVRREAEEEIDRLVNDIINAGPEKIAAFSDYRNYMTYDIDEEKEENGKTVHLKLSKQDGSNSGAETQIPYLLTLISSLLVSYGTKTDRARLLFLDEPFTAMDPDNAREMIEFLKDNNLQVIFFAPGKIETIGGYCDTKNGVMSSADSRKMMISYITDDEMLEIYENTEDAGDA